MPSRRTILLITFLATIGIALFATRIDGVFTIDEDSYVASVVSLRAGGLGLPGTDGLLPSRELLSFDPDPLGRNVMRTPVVSIAPPLYGVAALPFVSFGWPGLVAFQVLCFLACSFLVFRTADLHARRPATPWLALVTFVAGGYSIEYAQGVWPHALSMALCAAAFYCAARARSGGAVWFLVLSGLAAGAAIGVRYQNVVFGAMLGLGVLVLVPRRRIVATAAFGAAWLIPIVACSVFNHARIGSWNPVSKGGRYLAITSPEQSVSFASEAVVSTWARVVDRAVTEMPPLFDKKEQWLRRDRTSGAMLIEGAMKKAWLQSSPWVLLAMLGLVSGWVRRGRGHVEARAASLITGGVLSLFALYGFRRFDGLCFNERYLLELVPILSAVAAWQLDEIDWQWLWLGAGGAAGAALPVLMANDPALFDPIWVLSFPPLILAIACAILWLGRNRRATGTSLLMGACIGWALAVHLTDDLPASRRLRRIAAIRLVATEEALASAGPSAIFAMWGARNALGPLLLERDLVIVDPAVDGGVDAPRLIEQLRARNRRIFFIDGVPPELEDDCPAQRTFWRREVRFVECFATGRDPS